VMFITNLSRRNLNRILNLSKDPSQVKSRDSKMKTPNLPVLKFLTISIIRIE
jgi:hypothetical protein